MKKGYGLSPFFSLEKAIWFHKPQNNTKPTLPSISQARDVAPGPGPVLRGGEPRPAAPLLPGTHQGRVRKKSSS